ncbi:hypothetical protein ACIBCN_05330 [Nocardia sp. NPDC051052]|uniref:hypothetical protein n=1 Tax=Nocardia sp. NPDC051052 TaxID=3364322 RepID=UPI0037AAA717
MPDAIIEPVGGGLGEGDRDLLIDNAFDDFVASGATPWLLARIGPGIYDNSIYPMPYPQDGWDIPCLRYESATPGLLDSVSGPSWYLPGFALVADDPAFSFAAVQSGVDPHGDPFNRARLTFSVSMRMPDNIAALYRESPDLPPRLVADLEVRQFTLSLPVTDSDGNPQMLTATSGASYTDAGTISATFDLIGDAVEAAYVHLTRSGNAVLGIAVSYSVYKMVLVTAPDVGFPIHRPIFHGYQFHVFGDGEHGEYEPAEPVLGSYRFMPVTARVQRSTALRLTFATDTYRSRFTITADGTTRPIIDSADLSEFAGVRSEYRELTTLGNVSDRYPTLRRLYFGQVSGTVVAVPAAYGIVRGAKGLAAVCDSIVDDSPGSLTGCRFHFTFLLAPLADPIDLAQLAADLPGIPEAAGRRLRLTLPVGLDPHHPGTLDGFPAATAVFADGVAAHTVQAGVDITDDRSTPATTTVNLFLQQLATRGPAPLFAALALRLDDAFPGLVRTQATFNLHQTADSDDLTAAIVSSVVQVANRGPLDLVLHRLGLLGPAQPTVIGLADRALPAGQSSALPGDASHATGAVVSRTLDIPVPLPKSGLRNYVTFNTTVIQQVQHPLTINAAGLNFDATGITRMDVQISVDDDPRIAIPALSLSPAHPIDFVHVLIPLGSAVTGLDCTVVFTLSTTAGTRAVRRGHDFVDEPIFVVTGNTLV